MNEITRFLELVFRNAADSGLCLYVLSLSGQGRGPKEKFFSVDELEKAASYIAEEAEQQRNVYVSGALWREASLPRDDTKISAVMAFRCDIDILHDAHSKLNLPPDLEAARALVTDVGAEPTLLVDSGHGLHAWYVFKEPWYFDTTAERQDADLLSRRLAATYRERARVKGWAVDSVFDLGRVLRVPGTVNYKVAAQTKEELPPAPVNLLSGDGPEWNPSDLEPLTLDAKYAVPVVQINWRDAVEIEVDPGCGLPRSYEALNANDRKFKATYNHNRPDLPDQTWSGYDMALAALAARAGWTDQEITDLLVNFAVKYQQPIKRRDYYRRTIARAREPLEQARIIQEASESLGETASDKEMPDAERLIRMRQAIEKLLDFRIDRIRRQAGFRAGRQGSKNMFWIDTPQGSIKVGGVEVLRDINKFSNEIYEYTGRSIPNFKKEKWHEICAQMWEIMEVQDMGPEATEEGRVEAWLVSFMEGTDGFGISQNWQEAVRTKDKEDQAPFSKDGLIYFYLPALKKHIGFRMNEILTTRELSGMLRNYGCDNTVIAFREEGGEEDSKTSRTISARAWWIPPDSPVLRRLDGDEV